MYSEKVMDHFANPRNVGEIENPDGVGEVGNPVCGDIMKIFLKIEDNRVVDAKFKTFGCGAAIASSSSRSTAACWRKRRCTRPSPTTSASWKPGRFPSKSTRLNQRPA